MAMRPTSVAKVLVRDYLLEHEPEFVRLYQLQQEGWKQESGDTFFQSRRKQADTADAKQQSKFFLMMRSLGFELESATGALSRRSGTDNDCLQILDLCLAPGGYSAAVLALDPTACINGISLPAQDGGHRVAIPFGRYDPRVQILFTDITMLATEYGVAVDDIPVDHPDSARFLPLRPFGNKQYDVVLCDGQVLRTHTREAYREPCEATRLTNAQLILGLQRVKQNGTLIILLHKLEIWPNVKLIRSFSTFATIRLFKPVKTHAIKSSFYVVATKIQPQSMQAQSALEYYKTLWHTATFGSKVNIHDEDNVEEITKALAEFGPKLRELGKDVWKVHADALEKAPFMQGCLGGGDIVNPKDVVKPYQSTPPFGSVV